MNQDIHLPKGCTLECAIRNNIYTFYTFFFNIFLVQRRCSRHYKSKCITTGRKKRPQGVGKLLPAGKYLEGRRSRLRLGSESGVGKWEKMGCGVGGDIVAGSRRPRRGTGAGEEEERTREE